MIRKLKPRYKSPTPKDNAWRIHLMIQSFKSTGIYANDPATNIVDILTDIRHFCDLRQINYEAVDRIASMHYDAETNRGAV